MGLFLNQQDGRSKLQEKIAADLRQKTQQSSLREKAALDDELDFKYIEGTKTTTSLSLAWLFIAIMAAAIVIMFIIQTQGQ